MTLARLIAAIALFAFTSALLMTAGAAGWMIFPWKIDHGWRTWNVVAVRYHNDLPFIGWNAGLTFPHLSDSMFDDALLADCIEAVSGVRIYEGGEFPGEPMYVVIKGGKDSRESLNSHLQTVLPALDLCAAKSFWRQF